MMSPYTPHLGAARLQSNRDMVFGTRKLENLEHTDPLGKQEAAGVRGDVCGPLASAHAYASSARQDGCVWEPCKESLSTQKGLSKGEVLSVGAFLLCGLWKKRISFSTSI